ncbi:MAG: hypothetical protein ACYTKD_26595 [Planctomycetota bacterium]|jgi:hypothetical protein
MVALLFLFCTEWSGGKGSVGKRRRCRMRRAKSVLTTAVVVATVLGGCETRKTPAARPAEPKVAEPKPKASKPPPLPYTVAELTAALDAITVPDTAKDTFRPEALVKKVEELKDAKRKELEEYLAEKPDPMKDMYGRTATKDEVRKALEDVLGDDRRARSKAGSVFVKAGMKSAVTRGLTNTIEMGKAKRAIDGAMKNRVTLLKALAKQRQMLAEHLAWLTKEHVEAGSRGQMRLLSEMETRLGVMQRREKEIRDLVGRYDDAVLAGVSEQAESMVSLYGKLHEYGTARLKGGDAALAATNKAESEAWKAGPGGKAHSKGYALGKALRANHLGTNNAMLRLLESKAGDDAAKHAEKNGYRVGTQLHGNFVVGYVKGIMGRSEHDR